MNPIRQRMGESVYWGMVYFMVPAFLYGALGLPLTYVLFSFVEIGGIAEEVVAILLAASVSLNLGFFMIITTIWIHRHLEIAFAASNTDWDSLGYNTTMRLFLLIAYVWSLVCVSVAGLWMDWNIFWVTLSVGIPIMIQVYLSSDLSRYIEYQQRYVHP